VHHERIEAEPLGAIDFLSERLQRLPAQRRRRRRYVYEIAVVRNDRANAGFGYSPAKEDDFIVGQRSRAPLAGRLREDLQRLASRGDSAIDGPGQATRNGEMRAESRH
jgi:hypothetical protein